jgi:uncharacterized protein YyaL (SSP411 family)
MKKHTNQLIKASSPYLLQHANNPVNWVEWSREAFIQAEKENKLVLVSIGYAACHWCHVMEKECFEDEEVAEIMNKYFVCIKVDREERPDIDQIYMTAVQLMTQRGGWPLNCFTLPNGNPIYGGTYFPKNQWLHILNSLQHTVVNSPKETEDYANRLLDGIQKSENISRIDTIHHFSQEKMHELVLRWSRNFDKIEGGETRAPKFPLPSNLSFLLRYGWTFENKNILSHVELTLDKIAMGGIYDQVGGGFSRYSVDMLWKVPHFEKMLYDNGQLLSVYSKAYKLYKKPLYKRIVYQTLNWLEREMRATSGAFYTALDADSEGEEGKFYCWTKNEIKTLFPKLEPWVSEFYSLNQYGHWEDDKYILLRRHDDSYFENKEKISKEEIEKRILEVNDILLNRRSERIRPSTDDKCLTSWNAMTIRGLTDAYVSFDDDLFLHAALKCARWILNYQLKADGSLWRSFKNGTSSISGFLEDYANTIDAFLALYEVTQDNSWMEKAKELIEYSLKYFYDEKSGMFYFTSSNTELIARKMEIHDNVIPSSNSVMAKNLFFAGNFYNNENWLIIAKQMVVNISDGMEMYGSGFSNWAESYLNFCIPNYTVHIHDKTAAKLFLNNYLPHILIIGSDSENNIPSNPFIQICDANSCLPPFNNINEAITFLKVTKFV